MERNITLITEGAVLPLLEDTLRSADSGPSGLINVFKTHFGDSLSTIIISPDTDPAVFLFARLFRSHPVALDLSMVGSEDEEMRESAAAMFRDHFGFDCGNKTDMLKFINDQVRPQFPLIVERLFQSAIEVPSEDLPEMSGIDFEGVKWSVLPGSPLKGSLINRIMGCYDSVRGVFDDARATHLLSGLLPEIFSSVLTDVDIRHYLTLRCLMPSTHAVYILSRPEVEKSSILSKLRINLETKNSSLNSLRRILSYHPKLASLFTSQVVSFKNV